MKVRAWVGYRLNTWRAKRAEHAASVFRLRAEKFFLRVKGLSK
ncbi:hypothetical protein SAMN06273572_10229 [Monaibacterium marinum]|uniref:Uncharacterized protein n=1 Tax=Pontivivens marinum TaxID=1690039 RepID=A0A2C9CQ57_9RHOB|nr:hypothetical protein SAMN06273572_10229 [Monaibacterium marinum]